MKLQDVQTKITEHRDQLCDGLGVAKLYVFGSVARGEESDGSDLDILVEFEGDVTFNGYFELKERLEALVGMKVDLVTDTGLRKEIRQYVERDAIRVA